MSLLSCPLCLKPHFHGVDALRSSLISVATTHIACPVCNELLLGLDKFTIHLFSHIPSNKTVQTNENPAPSNPETVKQSLSNEDVDMPQETETGTTEKDAGDAKKPCVSCDICNFHFTDESILDLHHKLLHQTAPDKNTGKYSYHCHLCSKQFKMRGSLMVHLRVAHFGFIQNNYKNAQNCVNRVNSSEPVVKNSVIENSSPVRSERQSSSPLQGGNEKRLVTVKSQDNKQWECEVCLKLFTTKYFLKKHKRLHTGEMPYYCSQCNKFFTFQQSYHKHMLYHSDDKPHVCSECGRAFKELSTLHNHERIHSGERPFSCETCGKCFRQRVSYLVHRRIHTGVMPYKCTACNKSFRYKVSQRSHKCPVNPPGCVIRTPNLIEKLVQNRNADHGNIQEQSVRNANEISSSANMKVPQQNVADVKTFNSTVSGADFGFFEFDAVGANAANSFMGDLKGGDSSKEDSNEFISNSCCDSNKQLHANYSPSSEGHSTEDVGVAFNSTDNTNPDFFALILSPVLSDVQSLCLSNYTNSTDNGNQVIDSNKNKNDALETINEESLKELLYGPGGSNK